MRTLRISLVCVAVGLATLVSGAALAKDTRPPGPPSGLRGFLLRPNEPVRQVFPRTPAFAWNPVRGAKCYEFELATSRGFGESSIIWSNVRYGVKPGTGCAAVSADGTTASSQSDSSGATGGSSSQSGTTAQGDPAVTNVIQPLRVPAVSVDVALPWFTGNPYALYAHVRAITDAGPTRWSKAFAFNMRWESVPTPLGTQPGLVRWSPIQGATGYQVWYPSIGKVFATHTNVADLREFYTFHRSSTWWSSVPWRVRAVRRVFGQIPNGLPAVSYGPWSKVYTSTNPDWQSGPLKVKLALSDRVSDGRKQSAHELMPAFSFTGDQGLDGRVSDLYRAYAFTDRDCVNVVFRSSVIGGPAFAPRTTGPLKLPTSAEELTKAQQGVLKDTAKEPDSFAADGMAIASSETVQDSTAAGAGSGGSGSAAGTGGAAVGGTSADPSQTVFGAKVDLPDIDFPTTRYYWTVVPVTIAVDEDKKWRYVDLELPQDACGAGRVESFGKESEPVVISSKTPYVSGLTPSGRLLAAVSKKRPVVYSSPLVAWEPAIGATAYEVQWSRTRYPWRAQGAKVTYSTSAVLDLAPGTWFYRVRGLNQVQLKKVQMAWSAPGAVTVAKPTFTVAKAVKRK